MPDEEPSLNIPSLLTLAVVSFFVIRWFLNRDQSPGPAGARSRRGNVVDPAQVEQISQMFPQLSTRDIMWDLQRNGGSVAATTERILTGRGLDVPPPSFQPHIPAPSTSTAAAQTAPAPRTLSKADSQDLISRYNLASKIGREEETTEPFSSPSSPSPSRSNNGWSQNKEERQRLLQKRRDDMILAARQKMMQKDQNASRNRDL
ncbi:hypothetical protein ASPZODRAFT_132866 [Penicilliopsis zonata CBS 506.65]|uniref:Coupling of ubiquitin conjugation to ER degradation protein 1 n=1 Tax=Penicilliopsis zonata CBS 506.65 TaxID=1073090 RepID=A0A1L9SHP8_9EURO|nr:hypothetical protein ASPZODRAFT_132866 [Penicilliopsis zonata CBS 506.65]OJJ46739.1 hypothetical protein ASPZODRAFT_132866 [Penicilliopsis zonata CBS 506.65]